VNDVTVHVGMMLSSFDNRLPRGVVHFLGVATQAIKPKQPDHRADDHEEKAGHPYNQRESWPSAGNYRNIGRPIRGGF